MANSKKKGFKGKSTKKSNAGRIWIGIVGVALVGLIAVGMTTVFQRPSVETADAVAVDVAASDSSGAVAEVVPITDRETAYLGASTDATALARAENGETGNPTLVMFHADW